MSSTMLACVDLGGAKVSVSLARVADIALDTRAGEAMRTLADVADDVAVEGLADARLRLSGRTGLAAALQGVRVMPAGLGDRVGEFGAVAVALHQ